MDPNTAQLVFQHYKATFLKSFIITALLVVALILGLIQSVGRGIQAMKPEDLLALVLVVPIALTFFEFLLLLKIYQPKLQQRFLEAYASRHSWSLQSHADLPSGLQRGIIYRNKSLREATKTLQGHEAELGVMSAWESVWGRMYHGWKIYLQISLPNQKLETISDQNDTYEIRKVDGSLIILSGNGIQSEVDIADLVEFGEYLIK